MSGRISVEEEIVKYTNVPNEPIRDPNLSWKAKGLYTYLIGMKKDWVLFKSDISKRSTDGYDSMISGWNELEKAGYIQTIPIREKGLFKGYDYMVRRSPIREKPESVKPESENPQLSITIKEVLLLKKENIENFSFEEFWQLYPNKVAKSKCATKWKKLKESDKLKIKDTISDFIAYKPFEKYNHPNPETYLNQERWMDLIPKSIIKSKLDQLSQEEQDAIKAYHNAR